MAPRSRDPPVMWHPRVPKQFSLCYILFVGVNEIYFGSNCPKYHQAWLRYDNGFVEAEPMLYDSCFRTSVPSVVI